MERIFECCQNLEWFRYRGNPDITLFVLRKIIDGVGYVNLTDFLQTVIRQRSEDVYVPFVGTRYVEQPVLTRHEAVGES